MATSSDDNDASVPLVSATHQASASASGSGTTITSSSSSSTSSSSASASASNGKNFKSPRPVIHFLSLSVDYYSNASSEAVRGTVQLIEVDTGGHSDFYSISLDLVVKLRGSTSAKLSISLDDILTLRHIPASATRAARVRLHAKGAVPLGELGFPNGPDACQSFILALRTHATFHQLIDPNVAGTLYAVEAKPRMRRAAPTLMPLYFPQPQPQPRGNSSTSSSVVGGSNVTTTSDNDDDDEFNALLSDLNISSSMSSNNNSRQRQMEQRNSALQRKFHNVNNHSPSLENSVAQNVTMSLLTQFARVTKVVRDVGDHIVRMVDDERKKLQEGAQSSTSSSRARALSNAMDIHADIVASTDVEQELPPRMTLESARGVTVSESAWKALLDAEGQVTDVRVLRYAIFAGGVDCKIRPAVWPMLLGLFPWNSTQRERDTILANARTEYLALKEKGKKLRSEAQLADEKSMKIEEEGKDKGENEQKENKDADRTTKPKTERRDRLSRKQNEVLQVSEQIAKDVIRTDRTVALFASDDSPGLKMMESILNVYATYNPEISYCQGMSDFLAPLLTEMRTDVDVEKDFLSSSSWRCDEALVFWSFERLMRRMEANFRIDQSGMHAQLALLRRIVTLADKDLSKMFNETDPQYYSCFRWIVVRFKRELPMEQVTRLWEVLWTREVGGDKLHIYVAAGLLLAHRKRLLNEEVIYPGAFDSLLRYVNDMSMRIDIDFAVHEGQRCHDRIAPLLN